MQKLCLSTKFPHQKIRWNYGTFCSRNGLAYFKFCSLEVVTKFSSINTDSTKWIYTERRQIFEKLWTRLSTCYGFCWGRVHKVINYPVWKFVLISVTCFAWVQLKPQVISWKGFTEDPQFESNFFGFLGMYCKKEILTLATTISSSMLSCWSGTWLFCECSFILSTMFPSLHNFQSLDFLGGVFW